MKKNTKLIFGSLAVAGLLFSGGAGVIAHGNGGSDAHDGMTKAERQLLKKSTARYHSLRQAEKAGYMVASPCVSVPGLGGMGFHYVNESLIDEEVNIAQPEALLYVPTEEGLKLVGVEYLSDGPNELFGVEFDGPGAVPQNSLHVWVWEENPLGTFAPLNPAVSCSQ